ncbi:glycosyl transferase [Agromyces luteolus]|uniref:Glycosyltransferase n=1 Tax=Agromyces luteolus TaxID=88373 RepID=A0A7C9LXD1_9MICO|nr:nucleotide disphospho-sugar-binding domain-containing protein [Agromyces luteolus]MUN08059.1 glycosyltransferase [Agromyces luteolus]GLK27925.1 glycosyl transferase [Agromyces luteolus]
MTHPNVRTYLFALTDAGGTVPPEVGVVRRVVDRGHRVTVLADETMAADVERAGAAVRIWRRPFAEFRDWELRTPLAQARGMAEHMLVGPAGDQADDTGALIDEIAPDLVVTSGFALGAMIAAESRGVPFDLIMPNVYVLPADGMPPFGAGLAPAHGPLGRARDRAMRAAGARLIDRYTLRELNELRELHGLDPIPTLWGQMGHARMQLVLTSAAFDFPATLPANARYVGPILDDPDWADAASWTPPDGDGPLVLVAMSSTFQDHVGCLQRIADGLGELPVRGLVTTGPAVEPGAIAAPANVTVVASAPHREVLPHADLVVTHGGHGTVIKALAAGVPLVILHHGRDQADNAVRVTERHAGVAVPRTAPSARIARAVAEVLGDASYRESAEGLGRAIMRDVAESPLLDELERVPARR